VCVCRHPDSKAAGFEPTFNEGSRFGRKQKLDRRRFIGYPSFSLQYGNLSWSPNRLSYAFSFCVEFKSRTAVNMDDANTTCPLFKTGVKRINVPFSEQMQDE